MFGGVIVAKIAGFEQTAGRRGIDAAGEPDAREFASEREIATENGCGRASFCCYSAAILSDPIRPVSPFEPASRDDNQQPMLDVLSTAPSVFL